MADEISTLALNVDLDCHPCYKQMKKALCKFPEIESHKFDEEQKKVIISGPFEPEKLIKKLCCKVGCKIIIGYVIILEQPKPASPKPDCPNSADCNCRRRNPTCHCNGSRGNCQCGCGGRCSRPKSQDNCQCGCGGCCSRPKSQDNCQCGCGGRCSRPKSQDNCQCGCGGHCPPRVSRGNCQCGCGGHCPPHGSQGTCQCGCGGQSGCRFLIEEESGCSIM